VAAALSLAREVTGKPVIAYPNSGESWNGAARGWEGATGPSITDLAPRWVASGARVIGGCCRVTPADIAQIARACGADCRGRGD
jgi:homocysteine S-methyltransferase